MEHAITVKEIEEALNNNKALREFFREAMSAKKSGVRTITNTAARLHDGPGRTEERIARA